MAQIVAGLSSSHAFALMEPTGWDDNRARNRAMYGKRYGELPPEHPQTAEETDEDIQARYERIRDAHGHLRRRTEELAPQALVLVADDQNENFTDSNLPQIAIYLGDEFVATPRGGGEETAYHGEPGLAKAILHEGVAADFDISMVKRFPNDKLIAHACGPLLRVIDPTARIPVVLVFVNAIHVPAPSPARCYALGQIIRQAVEGYTGLERVAICASGGLSHFTGGYPWDDYEGPFAYGAISEQFDAGILGQMQEGEGHLLSRLSSKDLIDNGEIELRSWIVMLGAIGNTKPELLVYEPFYRGIMGMGVGFWDLTQVPAAAR